MSDDTPPPAEGSVPPPPPPPPPPAPAGSGGYAPVEAIQYGWAKFTKSPGAILIPGLVSLLIVIAIEVVIQLVLTATILGTHDCTVSGFGVQVETQCGPGFFVRLIGAAIGAGLGTFVSTLFFTGLIKSALNIVDGQAPLDLGGVLSYASKPNVITTAVYLGALSAVGTLVLYVGGIVISFLTAFTLYFVVDRELAGLEAIKASFDFVTGNLGDTVLFFLLGIVTVIVGLIACLVGIFAAVPVLMIAAGYTYRLLQGQPASPVA